MDWQGTGERKGMGRRETYGEEDTIRNGEVSLNACAVAARAASARIVCFIIAVIDAVPQLLKLESLRLS